MGLFFVAAHGLGRPKRLTYPTMLTLGTVIPYPKNIQKYLNHVTHHLSSAGISIFFLLHRKSANFAIRRHTDIDCILTHNF